MEVKKREIEWSLRWITPVEDCDWRVNSSVTSSSGLDDEMVREIRESSVVKRRKWPVI